MVSAMGEIMEETANDNQNIGVCCRRCECRHCPAYTTIRVRGRTKRYRQCRNCGHRFTTLEYVSDDVSTTKNDKNPR